MYDHGRSESLQRDRSTGYQVPHGTFATFIAEASKQFSWCAIAVHRRAVERAKISRNADVPRPIRRRNALLLSRTKIPTDSSAKKQPGETNEPAGLILMQMALLFGNRTPADASVNRFNVEILTYNGYLRF